LVPAARASSGEQSEGEAMFHQIQAGVVGGLMAVAVTAGLPTVTPGLPAALAGPGGQGAGPVPAELSVQALGSATYQSAFTGSRTATLTNGTFTEPGTQVVVRLGDRVAYGQVNGQPAAAVILATNSGGSGVFVDLALLMIGARGPLNVATEGLGDRVRVEGLTIADNQVTVEMVQAGPNDPMCCPTQRVRNAYRLNLERALSEVIGSTP
jgi:hypothetical protein